MKKFQLSILAVMLFVCFAHAQDELRRRYDQYTWEAAQDPSYIVNASNVSHTIKEKGALWLRLYFKDATLDNGSTVTVTSTQDGAAQVLDAYKMAQWNNTSAYFNGDEVTVTLNKTKGSRNANISVYELEVGLPDVSPLSQCGNTDDRVATNDAAVGRIVPIGCTGWIIDNGKLVSAGHCVGSRFDVLEFNVPKSDSNGSIIHPGPENQYTITNYANGQSDWVVFEVANNTTTGLSPIQAQKKSFKVVQNQPGNTIRVTGFRVHTGSDNQTLQTHTGPLHSVTSTSVRYTLDTEGGNSGSPIIDEATGYAVGVHTNGGCSSNGYNYGTRATVGEFWDALYGGSDPDPSTCISVNFNKYSITSFSNQDVVGTHQIQDGGNTLYLENNTWKQISIEYSISAGSIIEFDFKSTNEGEIHGIALENDNSLTSSRLFKLYGTQNYGVNTYNNYSGNDWKTYSITVGKNYTGKAISVVFANDDDSGSGNTSYFRNVKVYDPASCPSFSGASVARRSESIENSFDTEKEIIVYPSPVENVLSIHVNGEDKENYYGNIYSLTGTEYSTIQLNAGANHVDVKKMSLKPGIYLLRIKGQDLNSTEKFVVK